MTEQQPTTDEVIIEQKQEEVAFSGEDLMEPLTEEEQKHQEQVLKQPEIQTEEDYFNAVEGWYRRYENNENGLQEEMQGLIEDLIGMGETIKANLHRQYFGTQEEKVEAVKVINDITQRFREINENPNLMFLYGLSERGLITEAIAQSLEQTYNLMDLHQTLSMVSTGQLDKLGLIKPDDEVSEAGQYLTKLQHEFKEVTLNRLNQVKLNALIALSLEVAEFGEAAFNHRDLGMIYLNKLINGFRYEQDLSDGLSYFDEYLKKALIRLIKDGVSSLFLVFGEHLGEQTKTFMQETLDNFIEEVGC